MSAAHYGPGMAFLILWRCRAWCTERRQGPVFLVKWQRVASPRWPSSAAGTRRLPTGAGLGDPHDFCRFSDRTLSVSRAYQGIQRQGIGAGQFDRPAAIPPRRRRGGCADRFSCDGYRISHFHHSRSHGSSPRSRLGGGRLTGESSGPRAALCSSPGDQPDPFPGSNRVALPCVAKGA